MFLLDCSGSMRPFWASMVAAFREFLKIIEAMGGSDTAVSVVTFDDKATIAVQQSPVRTDYEITFGGGGTSFKEAFKKAEFLAQLTNQGSTPVIVFMTDGSDNGGVQESAKIAKKIYDASPTSNKLLTFCVAFGKEAKFEELRIIC